jgi:hypothetical protein
MNSSSADCTSMGGGFAVNKRFAGGIHNEEAGSVGKTAKAAQGYMLTML